MRKLILALLLLVGCTSQDLPDNWEPLTTVVERPDLPRVSKTVVTTVSPYLFVHDLDDFWEMYPEGSVQLEALRRHEVFHAKRQEEYPAGKIAWLKRYLTDKDFRWNEEKLGYREGWLHLRINGYRLNVDAVAKILSGSGYNHMTTYDEAKQWIIDVFSGRT
jgi:hypothetical protein